MPQPLDGVEGSVVMHPQRQWLFFSNPHEDSVLALRYNMTLQVSKDYGVCTMGVPHWHAPGRASVAALLHAVLDTRSLAGCATEAGPRLAPSYRGPNTYVRTRARRCG